jgi:hypothetical protein
MCEERSIIFKKRAKTTWKKAIKYFCFQHVKKVAKAWLQRTELIKQELE